MSNQEQKIKCPKCGESISIDDVLTNQIEDRIRKEIEASQKIKETEIFDQKKKLEEERSKLEEEKKNSQIEINKKVIEKLASEKINLWKQARMEANKEGEAEKKMLEEQLIEKDNKLQEAQEKELEMRKQKNALADEKKAFEVEKQRQLDAEREKIREDAQKKAEDDFHLKISEKDKQLQDAMKANMDLQRKLQQGSQQTQGEVLELQLEEFLKNAFPSDVIEPVPKGINGADVVQKVFNSGGNACGIIAWESKHTKVWSEPWILKLKEDQRKINADIAVIVTEVLPKEIKNFGFRDGIWVTDYNSVLGLTTALRSQLTMLTSVKLANVGKNEKMEVLYNYLSGTEFRHKVEAIVEAFVGMKQDLDKEKRSMIKIWAKREKQIDQVVNNTAGMYGDVQGLIGSSIQPIAALEASSDLDEEVDSSFDEDVEKEADPEDIPF